jgi:hypothetical protein
MNCKGSASNHGAIAIPSQYIPGLLEENHKNSARILKCPSRDSNPPPPKYRSRVSLLYWNYATEDITHLVK